MCGVVGLYLKNPELHSRLGELFSPMLLAMTARGPDSAGFAFYGNEVDRNKVKFTLRQSVADWSWQQLVDSLRGKFGTDVEITTNANSATLVLAGEFKTVRQHIETFSDQITVLSMGQRIEILKEVGRPEQIAKQYGLGEVKGTHIIGHTRMATESAVTSDGSHPFSAGMDLCLVHNGSFSNHNQLREALILKGFNFETENDTEVAAVYLTWQLSIGKSLEEALEAALVDLDGFYTLAVGTKNGFAVLRDPIACKPATMAETNDYVAIASEYQSLAKLPGISSAHLWEPEPAVVYCWGN